MKISLYKSILKILACIFIFTGLLFNWALALTDTEQLRQELEAQINQIQEQIGQYQRQIKENQAKAKNLKNEINILEGQIKKAELEIQQTKLAIQKIDLNIGQIQEKIDQLDSEIGHQKTLLAEYIRIIARYDQESLLEIILKKEKFSDFFDEINSLESLQERIYTALEEIRDLKKEWEKEKEELEDQKNEQYQLKAIQEIQKASIKNKQRAKENILRQTKGQERLYQQMIVRAEKDIEFLKRQLSLLERYHLTLQKAVEDTIFASSKTGIRPAFLLAVLENESRLGLNVGTGHWRKDMYECYRKLGYKSKAEREKNAFFQICQQLGLNPDSQPVSAEPYYGCGGALGIAQFMPTTWLAYQNRVASLTGHQPPNPWRPRDSFTAAAIKLADGGANQRTEIGERTAYAKYLAGRRWSRWLYSEIVNDVIRLAEEFQRQLFD